MARSKSRSRRSNYSPYDASRRSLPTSTRSYHNNLARGRTRRSITNPFADFWDPPIIGMDRPQPVNVNKAREQRERKAPSILDPYRVNSQPVLNRVEKKIVDVCSSRQQRKEIMHATGSAGKRGQKTPVWTKASKVRCK